MDTVIFPDRKSLREEYEKYFPIRNLLVRELETRIEEALLPMPTRPNVKGRVKSFESYFKKYKRLLKNSNSPNSLCVSDLIGFRIICPFLEDLAAVEELLKEAFKVVEVERKGGDHTYREFGYESIHILIAVPPDVIEEKKLPCGEIAEIQIRTILQDAWAEVEHELIYKVEFTPLDNPAKRKLAAVNASLSLADIIFQEIRSYQRPLHGELEKRRGSFFRKIEESIDEALLMDGKSVLPPEDDKPLPVNEDTDYQSAPERSDNDSVDSASVDSVSVDSVSVDSVSIDELLVDALTAHNKNQFTQAITIYTQILDMKLDDDVRSLIFKHRGMAFFARSHYEKAIADFADSFALDPKSYKSAYYEGVVCSVIQRHSLAVDAFSRSLEINPYQAYCLFRRGQAYYHLADYPQALGDCEAALALESFDAAKQFKALVLAKLKM